MNRAKWKGFFTKPKDLENKTQPLKKISRNSEIIPKFNEKKFKVHNGKSFKEIAVTKDMLGHKFGEFAITRVPFEFKKKKKKKK